MSYLIVMYVWRILYFFFAPSSSSYLSNDLNFFLSLPSTTTKLSHLFFFVFFFFSVSKRKLEKKNWLWSYQELSMLVVQTIQSIWRHLHHSHWWYWPISEHSPPLITCNWIETVNTVYRIIYVVCLFSKREFHFIYAYDAIFYLFLSAQFHVLYIHIDAIKQRRFSNA